MNTDIFTLQAEGYANIEYPQELRGAVEESITAWKAFCALPNEAKMAFPYSKEASGIGYELKEAAKATFDQKEDMHFTLDGKSWLENAAKTAGKEAEKLISMTGDLVANMEALVLSFAKQAESEYGLEGFAEEVKVSRGSWFVRYLHYFGNREVGEEIAASHADKSGFTLHLYESNPGLERLTYDEKWVPMTVLPGETAIIPGMQLQFRSDNKLKATCHRVVSTEKTAREGRFSMVCFISLKNTKRYNKEAAGRLQERGAGFNYTIPFEEFSKLFA